jgi:hypothetical protein
MKKIITVIITAAIILCGCSLEPDPVDGLSTDGIVIYSGNEILNNTVREIVTGRVQQLRAVGPSGHRIIWSSDNELAMEITSATGLLRVGPSPNKEAVITARSEQNPSIYAQVTFKTKGLR